MALDGILIAKLTTGIKEVLPAKINKIHMISHTEILFNLHTYQGKKNLMVSTHSIYNRLNLTDRTYPTPEIPGNFIMVLRKHLEGSRIIEIHQGNLDRWCVLDIATRNMLGDLVTYKLYIELAGKYANIILVDENNKIIDALKRIPPFENSQRTIQPGAMFNIIAPQSEKKNPFECDTYDKELRLSRQFLGISPLLENEINYRITQGESFSSIMQEVMASDTMYIAANKDELVFHCIPLTHLGTNKSYGLHEALDVIYFHKEEKDRIKQITGDLFKFVKKEKKHYVNKLPKLEASYQESLDCDKWREYGDLLFAYNITNTKGEKNVTLTSFETGEDVIIPLDEKLDGRSNALKCYQKYNKGKKGQEHLIEQISICKNEIDYFESVEQQLELADFTTATEIRSELVKLGYLKASKQKIRKKPKKQADIPAISTVKLPNGIQVHFGKNNLQNDFLTWKMGRKNDTWMHAKDFHGAHVLICEENPDEATIRGAAMIAAYYSKGRYSSSVPINYCHIKDLKKIPGSKSGL
ncbi:MAG: fibronectin/fibrinogen-binding protein, partial [Erysipelotrichaceae bacterium]|nr:fibronectin/fibrinogen-binding protein [Erysipelotrichaceae bacterium]